MFKNVRLLKFALELLKLIMAFAAGSQIETFI